MKFKSVLLLALILLSPLTNATASHFKNILIIVFENTDYDVALKQPYFQKLANQGALLQNMNGMVHPSQGNYLSILGGDFFGVRNDNPVNLNQTNLIDLLENFGYSWKGYMENYPGNCFQGETSGRYARKHNPFISYTNISQNSSRCANIQDYEAFKQDVANNRLPNFAILSPNLSDDGHDTGATFASKWLQQNFEPLFNDSNFLQDNLVVITFDESSKSAGNHIYTVVLGGAVQAGSRTSQPMNHISLLKTVETEFNLGDLGRMDATASPLDGIWK
ncbi:MAG: alkaline phosphatase family protein [Bacillota bacterium]